MENLTIATLSFNSPLCPITVHFTQTEILEIKLNKKSNSFISDGFYELSNNISSQFDDYFNHRITHFDLPYQLTGTPFQKRVWQALLKIPYGTVITYGELAKKLKTSARAVGNACRQNPLPLIIPCHRVVSKTGLGGFSGQLLGRMVNIKESLITHEKTT